MTVTETETETTTEPLARASAESLTVAGKVVIRATLSIGDEMWASTSAWKWNDLVFLSNEARQAQLDSDVADAIEELKIQAWKAVKWRSHAEIKAIFGDDETIRLFSKMSRS